MPGSFGLTELLIILLIVVVLFGGSKIPQLGKGLGEGIRNFKAAIKAIHEDPGQKPETGKSEKA